MDLKPITKSHWFVGLTKHYGSAFILADQFAKQGSRSLEIAALGKQGLLIVDCKESISENDQRQWLNQHGLHLDRHAFLNNLSENVIKSYLSLENSKCENFLMFLQFPFLGDALRIAQQAESQGFKIVELRFIRSSTSVTHLILTGSDENKAKTFSVEHENFSSQLLMQPTDEVKKYFEIYPY